MTKQRSLKRLVRERMERTGESYTTAHRQITSRRPKKRDAGLLPSYPGGGFAMHRESALVQRLLASVGIELSEPMVCGLGGGVGFLYAVFEYKSVPHPLLTFVTQHHPRPWLEEVADNLAIQVVSETSSSAKAALKKLDAALDDGTPALLTVGRAGLPWYEGISEMEAYDPYTIVVAGRDGSAYVVDDCGDAAERISPEALAGAWSMHRKGRFAVQTLAVPDAGPRDLGSAVRAALRTTSDHMTGPVIGNAFDVNFGLSGIAKWREEVTDVRTKKGWAARFGDSESFRYAMGRLVDCFTVAYGAPGATRPIYAEFLEQAAGATGLDLGEATSVAAESGSLWESVVSVADTAADPGPTFQRIGELAREITGLEERLAELLGRAAAS